MWAQRSSTSTPNLCGTWKLTAAGTPSTPIGDHDVSSWAAAPLPLSVRSVGKLFGLAEAEAETPEAKGTVAPTEIRAPDAGRVAAGARATCARAKVGVDDGAP